MSQNDPDCPRNTEINIARSEAVAELKYEIERLRAALSKALSGSDDDRAIADFSRAMATKMAICRVKGRDGWQTCPIETLWAMLREHVEKGDPIDVGNFAMMIWNNLCEKELPPTPRHASAPVGYRCADCVMDGHACPTCYAAWWARSIRTRPSGPTRAAGRRGAPRTSETKPPCQEGA